jgi:diguanylate cyclase (GGDEF)-like protein
MRDRWERPVGRGGYGAAPWLFFIRWLMFGLLLTGTAQAALAPADMAATDGLSEPRFESVGGGAIPRDVVATMVQDRAGFLWIATGDGLVRHDGYRFRPQGRQSEVPAERNLGWLRVMLVTRDGRLWLGTESDGLAVYDPATELVSAHRAADVPAGTASTIVALVEDADGAIWSGSLGGGLERYEPASGRRTVYRHGAAPGGLPDDRVQALLIDRQGTLWVGSWQGLSRRVPGSGVFEPVFSSAPSSPLSNLPASAGGNLHGRNVQALFEASDGRIWAGTQQGDLALIDPRSAEGRMLDTADATGGRSPGASRAAVSAFVEAPGGQLWVGRASGIDVHAVSDGSRQRRLRHNVRNPAGLAANEVTSLLRDRAGWIWVGGFGVGLQRHNPNPTGMAMRVADPLPTDPFQDTDVRSILPLDNGELWLATHSVGVVVMDHRLRAIGTVGLPVARSGQPGVPTQPIRGVEAMAQAADGSVWLSTQLALIQFDRQRQPLRNVPLADGGAHRLLADSQGRLWVGTQDGLHLLEPGAAMLRPVPLADGQPLGSNVFAIAEAADRSVWIGGPKGLFRIAPGEGLLRPVQTQAGAGLGNPVVLGLLFDRRQTLWVDTAVTGLHRMSLPAGPAGPFDGRPVRFERISERHGVLSRPFGANLLEDERGRIWTHMHVYDPSIDRLDELTAADGARLGTGWFRSYARAADGRLLFGGSKGLLVVRPELYAASADAPPVVASELRINGERMRAGQIEAGLRIEPGQRNFSVEFAALDFSDPARNRYAHQLVGFDPDWVQTGADFRVASYSNLNPGDYVLKLRATNRSGVWSPHELAIPVTVLPAWWQRWETRAGVVLSLMALLLAWLKRHTGQLRRRQLELEQKVGERTLALEQTTLALKKESAALEESSLTDALTGLRNRRFLTQHIDAEVARSVRRYASALMSTTASSSDPQGDMSKVAEPQSLASHAHQGLPMPTDADLIFFLIDIDHFKEVNDLHGHAAGDAVIRQMRGRLEPVFRSTDFLVRWGGEEFLVVARDSSREHAAGLAARACAAVADRPFELDDGSLLGRSCSVGFSCFPLVPEQPGVLDWNAAVKSADLALYAVKNAGRNGWLGLLRASGGPADSLRVRARGPLLDWWRSGELLVVCSPSHADWVDSAPQGGREP